MSWPEPVGALAASLASSLDPQADRFPFIWWAIGARFDYPEGARHLFCKTGSAAEAFFFRPLTQRIGATFAADHVGYGEMKVYPQHLVNKYRLDFAVHDGPTRIAVEVDGLQFHHRSAEQIEGDYLRARRIIAAGYTVVRYTAAEAFRDAAECWAQLDAILATRALPRPRRTA